MHNNNLIKQFFRFSNMNENKIKLNTLLTYNFKQIKTNNRFKSAFKNDLMIRLAKRTCELENLPYGLSAMPSINNISKWYIKSFSELYNCSNSEVELNSILNKIYDRHTNTNNMISEGIKELNINIKNKYDIDLFTSLKDNGHLPFGHFDKLNIALDNFYTNRLSVRLLIDQYINYDNQKENYVGVINKKTNILNVLKNAKEDAEYLCDRYYDDIPTVNIRCIDDAEICYIPSHLYFVLFEILKNSMRACIEKGDGHVDVVITGSEDIIIKISDKGTGIPFGDLEKIWYYSYTTVEKNFYNSNDCDIYSSPLAGFGIGLPLSRSIVRFLDGEIKLMSMEGYGTDVFISLPREKNNY